MKNYFLNPEEHRLRAVWRLALFGVLVLGASIPLAMASTWEIGSLYTQKAVAAGVGAGLVLGVAWFQARFVDRRSFSNFGLSIHASWALDLGFGVLLGAGLMGLIFGIELVSGWIRIQPEASRAGSEFHGSDLLAQLALFAGVSLAEELISRAVMLRNLAEGLNRGRTPSAQACVGAWLVTSLVFGFLHFANESATVLTSLNIAVAGLLLGICVLWTGSLALSLGLHFSWNFFQGPIFGFPVSGENVGQTVFDIAQGGPVAMTGGAFGPEGGLLATAVTILGIGAVAAWVRFRHGAVRVFAELACPPGAASPPPVPASTPEAPEPPLP